MDSGKHAGRARDEGHIQGKEIPCVCSADTWRVVAAQVGGDLGVARARYVLWNIHTGESYMMSNNADHWILLPFYEPKNRGHKSSKQLLPYGIPRIKKK